MWPICLPLLCPLGYVCRLFDAQDLPERWLWSSGGVFRCFCPLSRFVFGALSLNMALFRVFRAFLAWFVGFVWVCVACVLCVACVAFVRVWSQADKRPFACFAFRFLLLSSCPAFVLLSCLASCLACFPALCLVFLSSCLVLFVLVVFVVVSFSLTDYTQKERAQRVVPCVLASCVMCVQMLVQLLKNSVAVALARSNSFGW